MPTDTTDRDLNSKLDDLDAILRSMGRVLIGYSGGVDSAMLTVAAHRVLADDAIAVTADSESYASGELEAASQIMQQFGIRHEVVLTRELDNPDYAKNAPNRCYFCKQELFTHMQRLAAEFNTPYILYGQNADDVGDFRPGAQAATDYGVRAPLQEAGLTKDDVRQLARRWDLDVWDRPAMACLSSRFPYGTPVTAAGLRMVDQAEKYLKDRGFIQLRVRHHTDIARLELPPEDLVRFLADTPLRQALVEEYKTIGYVQILLDLRGFRSGSMNEVLLPISIDAAELPERIASSLTAQDHAPHAFEQLEQMLSLRLPAASFDRLADLTTRHQLVDCLETLGLRYIALDLTPLD
jgi:uncharacterized protein